jgi:hypothetical protein
VVGQDWRVRPIQPTGALAVIEHISPLRQRMIDDVTIRNMSSSTKTI